MWFVVFSASLLILISRTFQKEIVFISHAWNKIEKTVFSCFSCFPESLNCRHFRLSSSSHFSVYAKRFLKLSPALPLHILTPPTAPSRKCITRWSFLFLFFFFCVTCAEWKVINYIWGAQQFAALHCNHTAGIARAFKEDWMGGLGEKRKENAFATTAHTGSGVIEESVEVPHASGMFDWLARLQSSRHLHILPR